MVEGKCSKVGTPVIVRVKQLENDMEEFKAAIADVHARDYEFTVPGLRMINLVEIAEDVDRNNPVAEVVVKGSQYKEGHFLIVHTSLMLKAKLILQHSRDPRYADLFEMNTPVVKSLDVILKDLKHTLDAALPKFTHLTDTTEWADMNSLTPFRAVLKMFEDVVKVPMYLFDYKRCDVIVRFR